MTPIETLYVLIAIAILIGIIIGSVFSLWEKDQPIDEMEYLPKIKR